MYIVNEKSLREAIGKYSNRKWAKGSLALLLAFSFHLAVIILHTFLSRPSAAQLIQ